MIVILAIIWTVNLLGGLYWERKPKEDKIWRITSWINVGALSIILYEEIVKYILK
jgi:predicted membrane channel-forming protein YqfA (hemolysin III family)